MEVYAIEYAPDGEHYSVFKKGKVGEMWDYFVMDRDIRESLILNPSSKFRLRNLDADRIIGAVKFDREKMGFFHLRE